MKRKIETELDREMVIAQIKRLDLVKKYFVEITRKYIRRTISQNNLYWLWLTCIEFETGNDRYFMHDYYMRKFLLPDKQIIFGEEVEVYTTKNKDTLQFSNYLNRIQIHANAEAGIPLPDPDDYRWEEFYSFYSEKL